MVVVVVTLHHQTRAVVVGPEIVSRGFVHLQDQEAFFDAANHLVKELLAGCPEEEREDANILREKIRVVLRKFIHKTFDRRPMILPIIIEV